jgi:hypothetical protein
LAKTIHKSYSNAGSRSLLVEVLFVSVTWFADAYVCSSCGFVFSASPI